MTSVSGGYLAKHATILYCVFFIMQLHVTSLLDIMESIFNIVKKIVIAFMTKGFKRKKFATSKIIHDIMISWIVPNLVK